MAQYANMLADIILGKKTDLYIALNAFIDTEKLVEEDSIKFIKMAYCYYKLKDAAISVLTQL